MAGRPSKGLQKISAYVPPEFAKSLKHEAIERGKTLGDLIVEAFSSRVVVMRRASDKEGETK